MKSIIIFFIVVILSLDAISQDVSFSQFYKNPIYLNPSLTALQPCGRLYTNYRETALGAFDSRALSVAFDLPFTSSKSGLGGIFQYFEEGLMYSGTFAVQFSRKVTLFPDLFMTLGLEVGGCFLGCKKSEIVLPSTLQPATVNYSYNPKSEILFDASPGIGFSYKNQFAGVAVKHITESRIKSSQVNSVMHRCYIVHYGARILYNIGKIESFIAPQFIYERQAENNHLTTGVYAMANSIGGGVWVRNEFPFKMSFLILMATINTRNFEFAYSYDIPINGIGFINGGHEVSIIYYLPSFLQKYHKLNSRNCLSF